VVTTERKPSCFWSLLLIPCNSAAGLFSFIRIRRRTYDGARPMGCRGGPFGTHEPKLYGSAEGPQLGRKISVGPGIGKREFSIEFDENLN